MNLEWGVAWVWTKPYVVGVLLTVSTGQMTNTAVVPLAVVPFPTAIYITWMGWRGWVAALKLNNWMDGTSTTCWPRGWAGTSSGLLGKVIVVSATLCEYTWQPLMLVLLNRIMLASTNCGSKNELDMCRRQNRKQRIDKTTTNYQLNPIEMKGWKLWICQCNRTGFLCQFQLWHSEIPSLLAIDSPLRSHE